MLSEMCHAVSLAEVSHKLRIMIRKHTMKNPRVLEKKMEMNLFVSFQHKHMLTENLDVSNGILDHAIVKLKLQTNVIVQRRHNLYLR